METPSSRPGWHLTTIHANIEESDDIAAQEWEQYDAVQGFQPVLRMSAQPLGNNIANNEMLDLIPQEDDPVLNRQPEAFSAEN